MLITMQTVMNFAVTEGLSERMMIRNCYCRIAQTQMQYTLKGNAFEQPLSFDIKHISSQLINNLL